MVPYMLPWKQNRDRSSVSESRNLSPNLPFFGKIAAEQTKQTLLLKAFIVMVLVTDLSVSRIMKPFCSHRPGLLKLREV